MRALYRFGDKLTIEVESDSAKGLFEELAKPQEVFGIQKCHCGSDDVFYQVREVDGFRYYELSCRKCRRKLSFGQHKTLGTLYPRRRAHKEHPLVKSGQLKVDDWLPDGGWALFVKDEAE